MKSKKILALLMAGALAVSGLAGCGGSSSNEQETSGDAETGSSASTAETDSKDAGSKSDAKLTIWVYGWEKPSADAITEDAKAYQEETGVEVSVVSVASDSYSTKMQATLAGGNNPDLAFIDAGVLSMQLAAKGKLLPLKQFGVEEYKDKFYDSVWDTMAYRDDVYGLRITSNNLGLFYNKEMFANAKLEEPTADWTWEDLRSAAKTLTNEEKGIYGLDLPIYRDNGGYAWTWLPFLWQSGGQLLNEDRTEAIVNSPEGVKALEFWKSMVQEDKSCPLQAPASGVDRFSSGISAMCVDGPWMLNVYLNDPEFKDKFGIAPLPQGENRATVVGGEGVVCFNNTKYPQEAYDYLVHLCCSDFTKVFWDNWTTVPPQPEFKDYYADNETYGDYIQIFSDQMECAQTRQFTPSWPQIEDTLGIDLQAYMFDMEDDAQAALDKAAADINKILEAEAKEYGE